MTQELKFNERVYSKTVRGQDDPKVLLVNSIAKLLFIKHGGNSKNAALDFMEVFHENIEDSIRNSYELCGYYSDSIVPLYTLGKFLVNDSNEMEDISEQYNSTLAEMEKFLIKLCDIFYK